MEENKKDNSSTEKPRIEIEINKYKRLVDVLNSPELLARAIVVVAVIITLVFVGISVLTMVIKRFYPYKAVETNKYGATVIKNEDTEVTYWLFNSADLWANSGIKVEKGQRITVRTSGAFHSAIHHLVEDAGKNQQRDKWLNATGGMQSMNDKDKNRSKYRIAPEYEYNTVIMQVVPSDVLKAASANNPWFNNIDNKHLDYIDGGMNHSTCSRIYKIGEGYENIEIQEDGVLCFACNDVALTDRKIKEMKKSVKLKVLQTAKHTDSIGDDGAGKLHVGPFPTPINDMKLIIKLQEYVSNNMSSIKKQSVHPNYACYLLDNLNAMRNNSFLNDSTKQELLKSTNKLIKSTLTELDYYYINSFVDAWFVDNVGSFLIVVEREK